MRIKIKRRRKTLFQKREGYIPIGLLSRALPQKFYKD
jgi:hypothetical protein